MQEHEQGARRLARALRNRACDPAALQRIARALDYMPEQLRQDIEALETILDKLKGQDPEE